MKFWKLFNRFTIHIQFVYDIHYWLPDKVAKNNQDSIFVNTFAYYKNEFALLNSLSFEETILLGLEKLEVWFCWFLCIYAPIAGFLDFGTRGRSNQLSMSRNAATRNPMYTMYQVYILWITFTLCTTVVDLDSQNTDCQNNCLPSNQYKCKRKKKLM